jgi:hypothetical protein
VKGKPRIKLSERKSADHPPRQCRDCPKEFKPKSGNQVRCTDCHERRRRIMWRARDMGTARKRKVEAGIPPERRYLFAPDFLLALPEMRAELARQLAEGVGNIHVAGSDESYIPNRRSA